MVTERKSVWTTLFQRDIFSFICLEFTLTQVLYYYITIIQQQCNFNSELWLYHPEIILCKANSHHFLFIYCCDCPAPPDIKSFHCLRPKVVSEFPIIVNLSFMSVFMLLVDQRQQWISKKFMVKHYSNVLFSIRLPVLLVTNPLHWRLWEA